MNKRTFKASTFWGLAIVSIITILTGLHPVYKIGIIAGTAFLVMIFSLSLHQQEEKQSGQHAFQCLTIVTDDNYVVDIQGVIHYSSLDMAEGGRPKEEYGELAPGVMENMTEGYLYTQIKQMTFYELLLKRHALEDELTLILNKSVHPWGLQVNRLFFQSIDLSEAMRKEMLKAAMGSFQQAETSLSEAKMIKTISSAIPEGEGNALHYLLAKQYITSLSELASQQSNNMILLPFETSKILEQVDTTLKMKERVYDFLSK